MDLLNYNSIHGFGGCTKATLLREYFKSKKENKKIIAPSLSYVPKLAIETLEELK